MSKHLQSKCICLGLKMYYRLIYEPDIVLPISFYNAFKVIQQTEFINYTEIIIKRPCHYSKTKMFLKCIQENIPVPVLIYDIKPNYNLQIHPGPVAKKEIKTIFPYMEILKKFS